MSTYDFNQLIPRQHTDSIKWQLYGENVLPLWVADTDFRSPEAVIDALQQRIAHGVFGYGMDRPELLDVICQRMADLYNWQVAPKDIVLLSGLVSGLNITCRAVGQAGNDVLVQSPVYPPFLTAPVNQDRHVQVVPLMPIQKGQYLTYDIDFDQLEATITPKTNLFLLCHPHNPIGRSFTINELEQLATLCAKHQIVICSDEIHADLLLDGQTHTPMAAINPEIANNCISLFAPSKTYNIAGLGFSFAIIQNPQLKRQFEKAAAGIVPYPNILGVEAALAAYQKGETWLQNLLHYLRDNRDFAVNYLTENLPDIKVTHPEATYLAWLDCRDTSIAANPYDFFLKQASVALNDGKSFGAGGEGFVRLNFGCPRNTLEQALNQMHQAYQQL